MVESDEEIASMLADIDARIAKNRGLELARDSRFVVKLFAAAVLVCAAPHCTRFLEADRLTRGHVAVLYALAVISVWAGARI